VYSLQRKFNFIKI